jgi:hypothetical protein
VAGAEDISVAPTRCEALKVSGFVGNRGLFRKGAAGA